MPWGVTVSAKESSTAADTVHVEMCECGASAVRNDASSVAAYVSLTSTCCTSEGRTDSKSKTLRGPSRTVRPAWSRFLRLVNNPLTRLRVVDCVDVIRLLLLLWLLFGAADATVVHRRHRRGTREKPRLGPRRKETKSIILRTTTTNKRRRFMLGLGLVVVNLVSHVGMYGMQT